MIKKLSFPYEPPQFENPCIQKFYSNLEALALGRDEPEEITDYTSKIQSHYSSTAQRIKKTFICINFLCIFYTFGFANFVLVS